MGSVCVGAARKMFMKLTPGLNFINILWAAFTHTDPESVKNQLRYQYLFRLLGSAHTKAACRLMKLTLGVDFTSFRAFIVQKCIVTLMC